MRQEKRSGANRNKSIPRAAELVSNLFGGSSPGPDKDNDHNSKTRMNSQQSDSEPSEEMGKIQAELLQKDQLIDELR